jgi:hypothetical protein
MDGRTDGQENGFPMGGFFFSAFRDGSFLLLMGVGNLGLSKEVLHGNRFHQERQSDKVWFQLFESPGTGSRGAA